MTAARTGMLVGYGNPDESVLKPTDRDSIMQACQTYL